MIVTLSGRFVDLTANTVIVEAYGVGRFVQIPASTSEYLAEYQEGRLLIKQVLREDADILYGFVTEEEKQMFEHLLSVPGVGGATALTMLSTLSVPTIQSAIRNGDESVLVKIKGVGAKTVKQIMLALKDKFPKLEAPGPAMAYDVSKRDEVVSGLVGLGFTKTAARTAAEQILSAKPDITLADAIRESLQIMSK